VLPSSITSRREPFNPSSLFTFVTKFNLPTAIASDQQRLVQTVPAVQSLRSVQIVPRKNSVIPECECRDNRNVAGAGGLISHGSNDVVIFGI
jgi:hypothetical protein